jgi:phage terminase large subunit-like protein
VFGILKPNGYRQFNTAYVEIPKKMGKSELAAAIALLLTCGQGFKDMSPPTKELMKLTLEEKIAHGGHPVLRWMMDNIFIRTDPAGNIKPDKEKSTERIDGAVATIMALDRAIRCGGETGSSVYDDRGLLIL